MGELNGAEWRKSSYSGGNGGNCVEIARNLPGVIAIRDSKDPGGGALTLPPGAFAAFAAGIRAGLFKVT
jgi:Domain of unknown function (DUF397)